MSHNGPRRHRKAQVRARKHRKEGSRRGTAPAIPATTSPALTNLTESDWHRGWPASREVDAAAATGGDVELRLDPAGGLPHYRYLTATGNLIHDLTRLSAASAALHHSLAADSADTALQRRAAATLADTLTDLAATTDTVATAAHPSPAHRSARKAATKLFAALTEPQAQNVTVTGESGAAQLSDLLCQLAPHAQTLAGELTHDSMRSTARATSAVTSLLRQLLAALAGTANFTFHGI